MYGPDLCLIVLKMEHTPLNWLCGLQEGLWEHSSKHSLEDTALLWTSTKDHHNHQNILWTFKCSIIMGNTLSDWLPVQSGVSQGWVRGASCPFSSSSLPKTSSSTDLKHESALTSVLVSLCFMLVFLPLIEAGEINHLCSSYLSTWR